MNQQPTASPGSLIYYRLIALWVLNEAMLGGFIHGLNIPVSGLVVGSCAVICICLIAWYVPVRGAIIKATIIVAIFKMMLSPHAPPPAYIAVFFQGILGELLFFNRKFYKLSCFLLATLALAESGLQRVIVLIIIYGNDFWKVVNDFIKGITNQKTNFNYSLFIAGGYVLLHLLTGLVVGWVASLLPARISDWNKDETIRMVIRNETSASIPVTKRRRRLKKGLFIIWVLLILLYAQAWLRLGQPLLPPSVSLRILVRSFIIVLTWYFVMAPLLRQLVHYWLRKKQVKTQYEIGIVLDLLPATRQLVAESWKRSSKFKGWKRLIASAKKIIVNALNQVMAGRFFILSGPVETGKTTSLVKWSEQRTDVFGILTPVVNGRRTFMDAHARHLFEMEASGDEGEKLFVGRFAFSKTGFDKAIQTIRQSINRNGWLIIDEIGPMELRGEGFREVVKEVIATPGEKPKVILVVRDGLVEQVKQSFQIEEAVVVYKVSDLV